MFKIIAGYFILNDESEVIGEEIEVEVECDSYDEAIEHIREFSLNEYPILDIIEE